MNIVQRIEPCDRLAQDQHGYNLQPDYDQYWKDRDYLNQEATSGIPTWIVHGVQDNNVRTWEGTQVWAAMSGPKKLWLGQWPHADGSSRDGDEWQRQMTAWWDKYLMGLDSGIDQEPPVDVQFNDGTWHTEVAWPPPGTRDLKLFTHPSAAGGGALDLLPPGDAEESIFDDPTLSENRMLQNPDASDPSRLTYRTAPLAEPVRIAGRPEADIWARSDMTSTHYSVHLADVDEGGRWTIIDRGFGNARYRKGLETGIDLVPGEPYEFRVPILDNDYTFAAGHSIGLVLSSSNVVWALPDPQRATNVVLHTPEQPTSLTLQVVGEVPAGNINTYVPPPPDLPNTATATAPWPLAVIPAGLVAVLLVAVGRRRRPRAGYRPRT
jgi:X-Pro dipeptidyl-peptidase